MNGQKTQIMLQTLQSSKPYWEIKNETGASADLYLYSTISSWGEEWGDTSAKDVIKAVKSLGDISQLNIYINSPGGTVSEGMAIKAFLARQTFKKDVYIDGLCASIATAVAFGIGATVHMESTALVMIHNAWSITLGNAQDMRKCADDLDKHDGTIRQIYLDRAAGKLSEEEISDMMAAETWLTASECLDYGFIDDIVSNSAQAAACMPQGYFDLYRNVPKDVSAEKIPDPKTALPRETFVISAETQAVIDKANSVLEEYNYRKEKEFYGK